MMHSPFLLECTNMSSVPSSPTRQQVHFYSVFFFFLKFSTRHYKFLASGCFVLDGTSKLSFNRQENKQPNYVDRLYLVYVICSILMDINSTAKISWTRFICLGVKW